MHNTTWFDLQLFAEGGEGTGDAGDTGENAQDAAVQEPGDAAEEAAQDEQDAAAKRKADFAAFKQEYKQEYDAEVQGLIKNRLSKARKAQEEADAFHEKADRIFKVLGVKHGIDPGDVDALLEAVEADDNYFEDEAIRRGMDVDALRELTNTKWENDRLRAQDEARQQQQQQEQMVRTWYAWEQEAKEAYPGFDLETEMQNEEFARLANHGLDFKTCYEIAHKDEVFSGAMKYGAEETARRMQNAVAAQQQRPDENALGASNPMKTKIDIEGMTLKQLEELAERARMGEHITLQS